MNIDEVSVKDWKHSGVTKDEKHFETVKNVLAAYSSQYSHTCSNDKWGLSIVSVVGLIYATIAYVFLFLFYANL